MTIKKFIKKVQLEDKTEIEKIELLAYFYSQGETGFEFTIEDSLIWLVDAGFSLPNKSRLKLHIRKSKNIIKGIKTDTYKLNHRRLTELEVTYGLQKEENEEIEPVDSIFPRDIFGVKRNYIQQLGKQINATYENNIFDGCAVLMRRLFEIMLIHTFEKIGSDTEIKNSDGSFKMLSDIVTIAKNKKELALSRNTKESLDQFRDIGNFAAHKIYYNTRKSDIDGIKINYRACIEELLYKSGIRSE
jgi:hypothetical protein